MSELPTLRELHAAILLDLDRHYSGRVETVAAYDPFPGTDEQDAQALNTPALLLELESIDPEPEDGTERQALRLTFAAHCILSFRTPAVQMELRVFGSDVMNHLRYNRWGYPGAVSDPEAIAAQPGEFKPGLAGFDSFLVRWEQVVQLGEDVWNADGIMPTTVYLGAAPEIGAEHEEDYVQVYPESTA
jgi:hypothetical protein